MRGPPTRATFADPQVQTFVVGGKELPVLGLQQENAHLRSVDFAMTSTLSEKDAMLAQLQPFPAVFPPECWGQLASFGPT